VFRAFIVRWWPAAVTLLLAVPAWAQEAACPDGEACGDARRLGAWGLIVIGVLFFSVWFIPGQQSADGKTENQGLPLIGILQERIRKETTGWRRWQWPLLGIFFMGIGIASLSGWH